MSVLFIGDLHCDKLCHRIPNFTALVLKTLTDTINIGLERGITDVVLCGDVFDGPNPTQDTIVELLEAISNVDCTVWLMLGNHDSANVDTHSLKITKWVSKQKDSNIRVVTEPTTLKIDGLRIWLLPHPYVEDLPKKYAFGVGHFAVDGAKSDNGFAVRTKHCPKGTWILGDFHAPQGGRSKGCKYRYVGSLTQLSFAEGEKKRVILLDDGELESIGVRPSYLLRRKTVSSVEQLPDVSDRSVFWQIKYTSDFNFPSGWLMDNPNVVDTGPSTKRKEKKASVLLGEDSEYRTDPLKSLEPFLRKKNLEEIVIKRALKIAKELRK